MKRLLLFTLTLAPLACVTDDGDGSSAPTNASSSSGTTTTTTGERNEESGFMPVCLPDELRCNGQTAIETCAPTGLEWVREPCGDNARCCSPPECGSVRCVGPCDSLEDLPSSAGCAFTANRNLHELPEWPDGIVLGNPNREGTAHVQIFYVPEGGRDEEPYEPLPELWLEPGEVTPDGIELDTPLLPGGDSVLRTGGIFRIYSDLPIIASQHSPLVANVSNESSLLLPDTSLGQTYVITTYGSSNIRPSYFTVVALEDDTEVEWTPGVWASQGTGVPIPPVEVGQTDSLTINRYETLQIVPSDNDLPEGYLSNLRARDVSGTVVRADKPIWVIGGARKATIPIVGGGTGDTLQEVLFPVEHWGTRYVVPSPPSRWEPEPDAPDFPEYYYVRLFAGQDDVTIESELDHPDFPLTLESMGEFVELEVEVGTQMVLRSTRKFLPVQYQRSRTLNARTEDDEAADPWFPTKITRGDPAMCQLVPVEQFLNRYTFATSIGFAFNYVQVTREVGNADVFLEPSDSGEATAIDGFVEIGEFEVATVEIEQGGYAIYSDDPFGIIQSGSAKGVPGDDPGCARNDDDFECNATYAYPGGMKAEVINVE